MRKDVAISAAAHAIILVWGTLSFAAKPYKVAVTEAFPIDLVPISEFSQMTAGSKTGAATKTPKPFAEKTGEIKPVENPAAKVVPKNEIKAANDAPPTPPKPPAPTPPPKATPAKATPQPPQPQRDLIAEAIKKEEAKPEPKPKPKPEPQRDEIAEAIKKTEPKPETKPEPKPEPKQAEAKPPVPPKKPTPAVPAFDPHQVMALLDKRTPQRQAAVGDTLVPVPQRGAPNAQAAMISQSELDALRARLYQLWSPPAGATNPEELVVEISISLTPEGRLATPPRVLTSGNSPLFMASQGSALRAIFRGQPFDMLKPEHYEQWKDIVITFDPRQMYRG